MSAAMLINARAAAAPRRAGRETELAEQIRKMMRRMRVAVVYGGDKSVSGAVIEQTGNPRSWKSYRTVAEDIKGALERLGCRDVALIPDDMRLGEALKAHDSHLAWLNSGGVQGHCSVAHAPAMLELFGIPYVGHDPMMAGILDNKHVFKRQLRAAGIPTAAFHIWQPGFGQKDITRDTGFKHAFGDFEGPFVVKPVSGRASLNVAWVECRADLQKAVQECYAVTRNHVLIERYLGGREYCVAVAGPIISRGGKLERLDGPFVFSHLERVLDPDEKIFTSMDLKPITGERAAPLDPVRDAGVMSKLDELATRVFQELGVETFIRLDVRADEAGELYVLEANPKPDLKAPTETVTSLVSLGLPRLGMTYDDLIMSILADRMDVLLSERRGVANRLVRLL